MSLTKVKAGNILLTTPSSSSNDTTPATTQYVTTALANMVDSAPSTLNTLNELAAALGDDANFSTTVTNSIATKLPLAGGTLTGTITVAGSSSGTVDALIITNTDTTNNGLSIGVDSSENAFFWNGSNTSMNFATNNTERMRIESSGTVKISHADTASEGFRVIQTTAARTSGGALGLFYDDQSGTTQPTLKVIQNGTGDILQLFDGASQVVTVKDGGNVGIGVVPETWQSTIDVLQVGLGASFAGNTANPSRTYLSANYYINSSNQESYIATDEASQYFQNAGTHLFKVAPSGSADSAISWTTAMTIHNDASIDAGGSPGGNVRTHGVVVSDTHRNSSLGTTLGDTQRVFGMHNLSQNHDYLTFRTRRITNGQSAWNHAVWDITRDIDNTSNLYKYLTFGIGELVVNDESTNLDFRVESDDSAKMLFVNAGSNGVYVGDDNADTLAHFSIQNPRDRHHLSMGSAPNSSISGTGQANYAEGVVSIPNVSSGTVLSIPHTSQPNLWRPTYVELMFVSGEYNRTAGFGGYAKVSYSMLTYLANVVTVDVGGNVASVSTSGMNLQINFTTGYNSGLSNYEGVQMHYKIMSRTPDYFQAWNATLN